jgi:undecaprenyl-diphosphatase
MDTSIFLFINGLSGKIPVLDAFFKGFSNDYFPTIGACLILTWMWFATRDSDKRAINQRAIMMVVISIAVVSGMIKLCNVFYFRLRPFDALPPGSVNLLFYHPTDSSFPSNLAAVLFTIATTVFIKNKTYGAVLLAIAFVAGLGRVYMGVHYPMDIVGGAAVGVAASFISVGIARLLRTQMDYVHNLLQKTSLA